MVVYQAEGRTDEVSAQNANLVHQLDVVEVEQNGCSDRGLELQYLRLRLLLLKDQGFAAFFSDMGAKTFEKHAGTAAADWYLLLVTSYKRAEGLGFSTQYAADAASVQSVIAYNDPKAVADRAVADKIAAAAADAQAQSPFAKWLSQYPRGVASDITAVHILSVGTYTFTVQNAFWTGISQNDKDTVVAALLRFANSIYQPAVQDNRPKLEIALIDERGEPLLSTINGGTQQVPF